MKNQGRDDDHIEGTDMHENDFNETASSATRS